MNYVDPRFFDTVGIPVVRGRGFREEDAAGDRRVALVSERAARQLWPGQDAIGRRIVNADTGGEPFDVIGVARDAHMGQTPFDRPPFVLYPFGPRLAWSATLHVRTDGPVSAATAMVTETIHRRDPTLAVFGAGSMDAALRSQPLLVIVRLGAAVIASFGMLGLLLAAVALYGVVSQATAQRRQEFGIRTALGATPAAITRLALGRGVALTTLGLALGAVAAAGAGRLATGFLVDVRPGDPQARSLTGHSRGVLVRCLGKGDLRWLWRQDSKDVQSTCKSREPASPASISRARRPMLSSRMPKPSSPPAKPDR